MKLGEKRAFCSCMLKNLKEHVTATTEEDTCCYCGYAVVTREVTEKDIRTYKRYGEELDKKKREALEILIKDIRYYEKVN